MKEHFNVLFLIGRPAAGKSEIIDFLKKTPKEDLLSQFHMMDFEEIDDFPMLWTWYEEDDIINRMGHERLHTTEDGYFKENWLWDLLIKRMEMEYNKKLHDTAGFEENHTVIVEFARGREHGGFKNAFENFSKEFLEKVSVIYLNVSFEESLRKNRKRFNPERPHSILEHSLPDEKLKKLYGESDWEDFSSKDGQYLHVHGIRIPYAVFENNDDVTTKGGEPLKARLKSVLDNLWEIQKNR